ncbi:D(4) dopamine receptor-like [Amblyraja radiata]|uniref:D(4) dopamine receptor-like n=1 Tax=Amblyraja radiata TaxID=386614 RepID=UPI001403CCF4|nr:D(4) dopamine receptor-like [Amblyraja radiata]
MNNGSGGETAGGQTATSEMAGGQTTGGPPLPALHIPALVLGGLLIVLIIAGNLLVCLGVATERPLRTATNIFIASLATSDLLLAVLVLPLYVFQEFQGGVWTLGPGVCDYLMTMDVMLCTASIFNLCAISVDRFIAVRIPLNYSRTHIDVRQVALISLTWILALAVASPIALGLNQVPGRDISVCRLEDNSYIIWSSVCSFLLPCPVMLLLYCAVLRGLQRWEASRNRARKLRRHPHGFRKMEGSPSDREPEPEREREREGEREKERERVQEPRPEPEPPRLATRPAMYAQPGPGSRKVRISGREHKAMTVLPVVLGAFLLCWTPFFVVHILKASCNTCHVSPQLISTVTWLGYVNSALNPFIYTFFNKEFRNYFRKVLYPCR